MFSRMESHALRKEAEDLEAQRDVEQRRRHFKKLEREGLMIMPETSATLSLSFFSSTNS